MGLPPNTSSLQHFSLRPRDLRQAISSLQERYSRVWKLKLVAKSDALTHCAPMSPLTWSHCSYRPTAATPLPMCTGSLETSIIKKTGLLFLCSNFLQQIDVQRTNWLKIGDTQQ